MKISPSYRTACFFLNIKLTSNSALDIDMDLLLRNAIKGSEGSSADSRTTALSKNFKKRKNGTKRGEKSAMKQTKENLTYKMSSTILIENHLDQVSTFQYLIGSQS